MLACLSIISLNGQVNSLFTVNLKVGRDVKSLSANLININQSKANQFEDINLAIFNKGRREE